MALARSRRDRGVDYWPGFVDALSTLILGIIFLLSVFVVVQFFLSQEVTGKDTALTRLSARIAQLTELLSLEQTGKLTLEEQIAQLRASLAATEGERDRYRGLYEDSAAAPRPRRASVDRADRPARRREADVAARAGPGRGAQPADRRAAPPARRARSRRSKSPRSKDQESQTRIADLGQRLNVALAQRVQELSRYRSDFFGRLRTILGNRPDIRIVGDRFVFQSEVFFDAGQAVLKPEGRAELDKIASALLELDKQIPQEIAWVLRVDGHTDVRPIAAAAHQLGTVVGARHRGGAIPRSARASRRSGWSPPASANSSRSIRSAPKRPSAATAASS